ncbi:glycoside hydrolase family 3 C-terminal domain-containing protein [Arthrobacter sp. MMS24-S77]
MNPATSSGLEAAIDAAIASLPLDRKVALLTGGDMFSLRAEPSIGLRRIIFSDGPTGVRGEKFTGGDKVAMFPNATLASGSWDEAAAERLGVSLGEEANRLGVDVVLGPTINLHRTPLGGRLFEAYSEDPLLSGRLAAAYVRGLQSKGIGASVKHFIANETETDRTTVDSVVGEQALREFYLLPYEICVQDARPWTIMAAYNKVNGVPSTEHDELVNGVLKAEWGFDGQVMSDWGAATSTGATALGGLDLVMPGPDGPWGEALVNAVAAGEVPEAVVNDHLRRLLRLAYRVGAWHPEGVLRTMARPVGSSLPAPDAPERQEELRSAAAAGITVMTNSSGVLPVDLDRISPSHPLLVIGKHAGETMLQGGGSAQVRPARAMTIEDGLKEALGTESLRVIDGVEVRRSPRPASAAVLRDPETGKAGLRVTSYDREDREQASTLEEDPRIAVGFGQGPHEGAARLELSAQIHLPGAETLELGGVGTGHWELHYDNLTETAQTRLSGDDPGEAILAPPSWLTRIERPSGHLLRLSVRPGEDDAGLYGLFAVVAQTASRPPAKVIAELTEKASGAGTVVVVVGLTDEQETEAKDKQTLSLPGAQDAMVCAVASAAERTIVVVNAATPVLMPWLDDVDAVIWAGLPGQEGGGAVADVLLGRREATGRLVTTFPAADGEGPAWDPRPTAGKLKYDEGVAMGYRGWYAAITAEQPGPAARPAFWFGHGLGWSSWEYLSLAPAAPPEPGGEQVAVTLRNSGTRPSREVIQLYLEGAAPGHKPEGLTERTAPVRLIGWAVAEDVQPGEVRTVTVAVDPRASRVWDTASHGWQDLCGGDYLVARGLGDIRLRATRPVPATSN